MQTAERAIATRNEDRVEHTETLLCHLVLIRHHNAEVLLLNKEDRFLVPKLKIPRWRRPAPHLVAGVRRRWGIDAICRFGLPADLNGPNSQYFVLDVLNPNDLVRNGTSWIPVTDINWADSETVSARERFYSAVRRATEYDAFEPPVLFTKTGWFDEVTDWVQSELSAFSLKLSGSWTQYNMGPSFSLIRYATDGPPMWFKAVGEPNLKEYEITARLQGWRSQHLPLVLATHSGWHGWLALDANGEHLDETWDLDHWKIAARSLATLQIESISHSESFIETGCDDLRISQMRRHVAPLLHTVLDLMEVQPATPPGIIDAEDLSFIETSLLAAMEELEILGIPDALGHSDLNPGNVLVNKQRAVFIDWMQGYIGHPFLTFEYLTALLRRLRPDLESWHSSIREAYCQPWTDICSEQHVSRALKLTPLLAPFAFALRCSDWQQKPHYASPQMAKLIRSLARKMFTEAQNLRTPRAQLLFDPVALPNRDPK